MVFLQNGTSLLNSSAFMSKMVVKSVGMKTIGSACPDEQSKSNGQLDFAIPVALLPDCSSLTEFLSKVDKSGWMMFVCAFTSVQWALLRRMALFRYFYSRDLRSA